MSSDFSLYINCFSKGKDSETFTKGDFLIRAGKRLGINILPYTPSADINFVLNVEPFNNVIKGNLWTGIWEIDTILDRAEMNSDTWGTADSIFSSLATVPDRLSDYKDRVNILMQAIDVDLHKFDKNIIQTHDFVFAGTTGIDNVYEKREIILKEAMSNFNGIISKKLPEEDFFKLIHKGKVQLMCSGGRKYIQEGQCPQRFFEGLVIGPVLTDWNLDLENTGLEDGVHFLSYRSEKEMIEKMKYLLDNHDISLQIAENGREAVYKLHTFENRVGDILKEIVGLGHEI